MTGDAEGFKSRKIAACLLVIALGAGVRLVELNRLSSFRDRDEIGYALVVPSFADCERPQPRSNHGMLA